MSMARFFTELEELTAERDAVAGEYQRRKLTLRAPVQRDAAAGLRLAREALNSARRRKAPAKLEVDLQTARHQLARTRAVMDANQTGAELHNAKAVPA